MLKNTFSRFEMGQMLQNAKSKMSRFFECE